MSASPDRAEAVGRRILGRVDSTNAEGMRRLAAGEGPVWILAAEQTAGRGRRGRPWSSPPGNLHATFALRHDQPPARTALRSFTAALALHDALGAATGLPGAFALKWPNDVLLDGGKVAGILLEAQDMPAGHALCVGFGANLIAAPEAAHLEHGALPAVTVLAGTGLRIAPEGLLDRLAPALARWDGVLDGQGFAPVRAAWLARAARLGEPIRARTGRAEHRGIFRTLDDTGALVLDAPGGRLAIPAAEVFF